MSSGAGGTPLPGQGISKPAGRALDAAGISTLEQLAEHSEKEVSDLHGMGPKVLGVLREALDRNGLSYRD